MKNNKRSISLTTGNVSVLLIRNKSVYQNVSQKLIFRILILFYINNQTKTSQKQT